MNRLRKRLCSLIFTFLSISFSLMAQEGGEAARVAPELQASLCEMEYWNSGERSVRDSLLLEKAALLSVSGNDAGAYETLCRISNFGLSPSQRADLLRRKLIYSYSAGNVDEFIGLLDEAYSSGLMEPVDLGAGPRHKSESAAMLLSVIPGAGLAYAGDWKNAGKYFALNTSFLALGAAAFYYKLYFTAFAGSGMLLYTTLPKSTEMAIEATAEYNRQAMLDYYAPVYVFLLIFVNESN